MSSGDVDSLRAKRRDRRQAEVRAEILEATRAVIVEDGFEGFALDAVARRVGLRKQALYYYFDSKEALLYSLALDELTRSARAVEVATATCTTGADALEQLIRAYFEAFRGSIRLFQLSHTLAPTFGIGALIGPEQLARIRPLNDMLFARTAKLLHEESSGLRSAKEARRLAFIAYTSVIGLLTMKAVVESVNDPLVHSDEDLVEHLVRTFRAAARLDKPKKGRPHV